MDQAHSRSAVPVTQQPSAQRPTGSRRALCIVAVLTGMFVSSMDLLIVNVAFPKLELSFGSSSLSSLSWVLSAYAIAFAALLMPAGRWADQSGRKRAFLSGLVLFTAASACCAAAPSLSVLVAARVLQGVGGAVMLPSSLGLLLPLFPPERHGAAVGLWSAMGGVAAAAGLPIGGLLAQVNWRLVFLVNMPIGVAAALIGWRLLPEIREKSRSALDVPGALVLAATAAAVIAAIVQGQTWGWGGIRIITLFVLGALGIAFSARRAVRHPFPVIEPAILRIPAVALADVATTLFYTGFGALMLLSTLFLTEVWRHSIVRTGLEIAPLPVVAALFAVPGGLLATRRGAHVAGMAGSLLFAAGIVWCGVTANSGPDYVSAILPGEIISGIGTGLVLPGLSGAATLPLPPERFATGTAMMSMCRQVGLALGAAAVAAILGVSPAISAFHATWLFIAACGCAAGLTLLMIGFPRRPAAARAGATATP